MVYRLEYKKETKALLLAILRSVEVRDNVLNTRLRVRKEGHLDVVTAQSVSF